MIDATAFNRAVTLWFELTDLDPNKVDRQWGDWARASRNLKESMELDDTLLTTMLLLDAYSASYFDQATVSVSKLDADEDQVFEYLMKVREFKKLIRAPDIIEARDTFIERLRLAMLSYGFAAADIHKVLDKRDQVAYLRRDSLLSAARMRSDHFLQGDTDHETVTPVYHQKLYSYWNINSMIDHLCGMPSGISLNLIRDPNELFSYFTFGLRNGANVIVLSDVPEYAHPLGRSMSRRPDRAFEERAGKNWFPYQLLNIAFTEEGDAYHDIYRKSHETGLTPHQPRHFEFSEIVKLEPSQAVWLTLMFDLIKERYWNQPIPTKALSYTGEMIRLEDQAKALVGAARHNLPVTGYDPLNLPALTLADVKTGALDEAALGEQRGNFGSNQWFEDRYGDKVSPDVLNLLAAPSTNALFLSSKEIKPDTFGNGKSTLAITETVQSMPVAEFDRYKFFHEGRTMRTYNINAMDSTTFGTRETLDADRKFLGRYNYVKAMQKLADDEYVARKDDVLAWFDKKVRANVNNLLAYAVPEDVYHREEHTPGFDPGQTKTRLYVFAKCEDLNAKDRYTFGYMTWAQVAIRGGDDYDWRRGHSKCYVNETASSWRLLLMPRSPQDLALLAGVTVEELPDILQHWTKFEPYTGNSILNRIDPLEWAIKNPWVRDHNFIVSIHLSKRARTKLQKEQVIPADHVPRLDEETFVTLSE